MAWNRSALHDILAQGASNRGIAVNRLLVETLDQRIHFGLKMLCYHQLTRGVFPRIYHDSWSEESMIIIVLAWYIHVEIDGHLFDFW